MIHKQLNVPMNQISVIYYHDAGRRSNICFLKITLMKLYFSFRKLYIADARPRKNALANGAMGGGSESSSNYFQSEVRIGSRFKLCISIS